MKLSLSVLLVTLTLGLQAFADDIGLQPGDNNEFQLGYPSFAGNGCIDGTDASATLGQNGLLLIDLPLVSQSDGGLNRQSCNMAITVQIPAGKALAVRVLNMRGSVDSRQGQATLRSELFTAGTVHEPLSRTYEGKRGRISIRGSGEQILGSACGRDTILRMNNSVMTRGHAQLSLSKQYIKLSLVDCE